MKAQLVTIYVFFLWCSHPLLGQNSEVIQTQLDSLNAKISIFETQIKAFQDSIKYAEQLKIELSEKMVDSKIAEHEAKVNSLLGNKGFNTLAHGTILREKPHFKSSKMQDIESGDKILVLSLKGFPFYQVKHKGKVGYVYFQYINFGLEIDALNKELEKLRPLEEKMFSPTINSLTSPSTNYTPSNQKSSNSNTSTRLKPSCSAVRCSGITKKGSRCKNSTTNCSGRCYQH